MYSVALNLSVRQEEYVRHAVNTLHDDKATEMLQMPRSLPSSRIDRLISSSPRERAEKEKSSTNSMKSEKENQIIRRATTNASSYADSSRSRSSSAPRSSVNLSSISSRDVLIPNSRRRDATSRSSSQLRSQSSLRMPSSGSK